MLRTIARSARAKNTADTIKTWFLLCRRYFYLHILLLYANLFSIYFARTFQMLNDPLFVFDKIKNNTPLLVCINGLYKKTSSKLSITFCKQFLSIKYFQIKMLTKNIFLQSQDRTLKCQISPYILLRKM